jgi:hypothetical protein
VLASVVALPVCAQERVEPHPFRRAEPQHSLGTQALRPIKFNSAADADEEQHVILPPKSFAIA